MVLHLKRTRNNWIIFQSNDYCNSSESDGGTKIATPGEIDYQELRTDACQICRKIAMKYYRRTTMNQSHFFRELHKTRRYFYKYQPHDKYRLSRLPRARIRKYCTVYFLSCFLREFMRESISGGCVVTCTEILAHNHYLLYYVNTNERIRTRASETGG